LEDDDGGQDREKIVQMLGCFPEEDEELFRHALVQERGNRQTRRAW
jgi:hypothetical protein